jgi:hypothetical protein
MTIKFLTITTLFIACLAESTASRAETVYKCGNSYSQSPCVKGQELLVEDTRLNVQKKQAENVAQSDKKLAESMQKDRLAQEQQTIQKPSQDTKTVKADLHAEARTSAQSPPTTLTPKRLKTKTYKPAGFVAVVPDSDQKPVKPKKSKKKKLPQNPA